MSSRSRMRR